MLTAGCADGDDTIGPDDDTIAAISPYSGWSNGPSPAPSYFPIGVWLQSPANAARYQQIGVNLFVGLWQGPTEEQLADLTAVGMRVICSQNEIGLKHLNDPIIAAWWMHADEPDNAQAIPGQEGYGPALDPAVLQVDYERMKAADPTRPVWLNLGHWSGQRGVGRPWWSARGLSALRGDDGHRVIRRLPGSRHPQKRR